MSPRTAMQSLASLTPREREVLQWVCECKSDADIGGILGISAHTVSKHLQRVFKKLGVENRMAAARFAAFAAGRNGWQQPNPPMRRGMESKPGHSLPTAPATESKM